MRAIQIITLILLSIFYIAYIIKMLMLKRHGIKGNLLGKGNKPLKERIVENLLRASTVAGAAIQFGSSMFPYVVWSPSVAMPIQVIGIVLLISGNIFFIAAMITMQENWRAGFESGQNTNLVTHGIYKISRNPAFVGFDLLYIGCVMVFPNIINIIAAFVSVTMFHIQILREEEYCAKTFGQSYMDYKSKTMRYIGA